MSMRPFDYDSASTIDEAISMLGNEGGANVRPLAGGTDLLPLMKADILAPERLLDIKRIANLSSSIAEHADGLTLGALTTLSEIERHPAIKLGYPLLAEAASLAATPQLRNMATLGGNLLQRPRCWYFRNPLFHCWLKGGNDCPAYDGQNQLHALFGDGPCYAVHPSDIAPALMSLDASVNMRGPAGERRFAIQDFYALPEDQRRKETISADDELILSVDLPPLPPGSRSTYLKAMERKVWAFALVGVAAVLCMSGSRIEDARLTLSGVAPIPWRLKAAEQQLIGATAGDDLFIRAADAALTDAQPLQHNGYKLPLARALIIRALQQLTGAQESEA